MAVNVTNYDTVGLHSVHWSFKETTNNRYAIGQATTLAAGSDSGSFIMDLAESIELSPAEARVVTTTGNDGPGHQFILPPESNPEGSLTLSSFDGTFYALVQDTLVYTLGDYEVVTIQPDEFVFNQGVIVTNSRAKSFDTATDGAAGYWVRMFFDCQIQPTNASSVSNAAATDFGYRLIANPVSYWPTGQAFSNSNEGTLKALGVQFYSPNPVSLHSFVHDGSTTSFVLDLTPAAATEEAVTIWQNGTKASYAASPTLATEYSVNTSTKTVTYGTFSTSGTNDVVLYQYTE